MNKDKGPKKSIYYYYMLALAILLLLNTVIIPMFFSPKVQEISYSSFLQMVDEGKVDKVEITNNKIAVLAKDSGDKEIYVTGRVEDPQLVNSLMEKKVEFSQVYFNQLDFTDFYFLCAGAAVYALYGRAHGRRRAAEPWQEQCQSLCGGADRHYLCQCSRAG